MCVCVYFYVCKYVCMYILYVYTLLYYIIVYSHVGAFQFIPQVTNIVNGEIHSFQQWHTSMMAQVDGLHSEELNESIKSSFNTVLLASQHIVKQYSILQSATMTSGMHLQLHWMYFQYYL